jgi:hypothetical protein
VTAPFPYLTYKEKKNFYDARLAGQFLVFTYLTYKEKRNFYDAQLAGQLFVFNQGDMNSRVRTSKPLTQGRRLDKEV